MRYWGQVSQILGVEFWDEKLTCQALCQEPAIRIGDEDLLHRPNLEYVRVGVSSPHYLRPVLAPIPFSEQAII